MIEIGIGLVLLLCMLVQVAYYVKFFKKAGWKQSKMPGIATHSADLPPYPLHRASVIICARNEAQNLRDNLFRVLDQSYEGRDGQPWYEVIVVNDQSTDGTAEVLAEFAAQNAHLKIVTIPDTEPRILPGKKFALSKGLEAAQHDHIVMTDADCSPADHTWIAWMMYPFDQGKEIVGGYGGFYAQKGLLNKFIRSETIHTYLQFLTYCLSGLPYMAVGRNLACKKELLLRAQQDPLWTETASGDDDLLIRLCATKDNMVVNTHHASFTWSLARQSWGDWKRQKQRHFSTGKLYRPEVQRLLGGYALTHALGWVSALAALPALYYYDSLFLSVLCTLFTVSRSLYWITWHRMAVRTRDHGLNGWWPLFDIGWLCYNLIFAPFIFWKNKQQWK